MKDVLRFVAYLLFAVVFTLFGAVLRVRPSEPLKVAGAVLFALGYIGLDIAIGGSLRAVQGRSGDHRTEALHRVLPRGRLIPSGRPLSGRQTKALLRAWEDFEVGIRRPEPARKPDGRGAMWDEWLDGDHTPRRPTRQKNPRGLSRG
jgi:hypothetical protein